MAGDWIKIRMEYLITQAAFREWVTPGNSSWQTFPPSKNDAPIVNRNALRCVTVALLFEVWCAAREHGKQTPENDCFLPKIGLDGLDSMADAPGIGVAMAHVGWAVEKKKPYGVILPKFFVDNNEPLGASSNAERQHRYRERKKAERLAAAMAGIGSNGNSNATRNATVASPLRNEVTQSRVEKRIHPDPDARAREGEKKPEKPPEKAPEKPRRCEAVSKYSRPVRGAVGPEAVASVLGRLKTKLNPQPTDGVRPNERGSP